MITCMLWIVMPSMPSTPTLLVDVDNANTKLKQELDMLKRNLCSDALLCAWQHNEVSECLDKVLPVEMAKCQECQHMMKEGTELLKEATVLSAYKGG